MSVEHELLATLASASTRSVVSTLRERKSIRTLKNTYIPGTIRVITTCNSHGLLPG